MKSILDIAINDAAFLRFKRQFDEYKARTSKASDDWKVMAAEAEEVRRTGRLTLQGMQAQEKLSEKLTKTETQQRKDTQQKERSWEKISRYSKSVTASVGDTTKALARWTILGGLFTTLTGGGLAFGLDRLAGSVGAGRRSALGLNLSYGQQRAFEVNYGRVINPRQFLSGVNEALSDPSKRSTLFGAGLTNISGNTGDVAVRLIQSLKDLVDRTPESLLSTVVTRTGGQFGGIEELRRLKATSREEFAEYAKNFSRDVTQLGVGGDTQRRWQDFQVQMERAGDKIEAVFVNGLDNLTPGLTKLSEKFAAAVAAFEASPTVKGWIDDLAVGLEKFAGYIGSAQFQTDVNNFVADVGQLVKGIEWLLSQFPSRAGVYAAGGAAIGGRVAGLPGAAVGGALGYMGGTIDAARPGTGVGGYGTIKEIHDRAARQSGGAASSSPVPSGNNPGNMRRWGGLPTAGGFAQFPSIDAGIAAMAKQLQIYEKRDRLDTISQIINKWAPPSENDTAAYIKYVSGRTGFKESEHLNLSDPMVLSKLIDAIAHRENAKTKVTSEAVIRILNNTGANVQVTAGQLAH